MTRIVNRRRNLADQCDACFYDWHEECREHRILGECCCGFEDGFEDDEP